MQQRIRDPTHPGRPLVEVALWDSGEADRQDDCPNQGPDLGLPRNLVLHHGNGGILDLDRLVKHLAEQAPALVPLHPALGAQIAVVRAAKGVEAKLLLVELAEGGHGHGGVDFGVGLAGPARSGRRTRCHGRSHVVVVVIVGVRAGVGRVEPRGVLPRLDVALVRAVQDDAQALVGGDEGADADEPDGRGENAPPSAGAREDEQDRHDEAAECVCDAHRADEEDAGLVAVADGPAHEAGVRLVAERGLDHLDGWCERRGMRRVLEGVEHGGAGAVDERELARGVWGDVVTDYAGDFGAEGLDADCANVS